MSILQSLSPRTVSSRHCNCVSQTS